MLAQGKRINVYTDSKYAFLVLHAHTAIWKGRGLITAKNSPIKHGPKTLNPLEAVRLPEQVAVMHCKGHQKDMSPISQGNRRADREAKKAALGTDKQMALFPSVHGSGIKPSYTSEDTSCTLEQGGMYP